MKWSGSVPRVQFAEIVQKVQFINQQLHKSLKDLEKEVKNKKLRSQLQKALLSSQQLNTLILEISHLQTFILLKEEFVTFCDFIICGSEMAEYLAEHKIVKKTMRNHARYWLSLVKKFKPFLKNNLSL
jgi:hypothetical protein